MPVLARPPSAAVVSIAPPIRQLSNAEEPSSDKEQYEKGPPSGSVAGEPRRLVGAGPWRCHCTGGDPFCRTVSGDICPIRRLAPPPPRPPFDPLFFFFFFSKRAKQTAAAIGMQPTAGTCIHSISQRWRICACGCATHVHGFDPLFSANCDAILVLQIACSQFGFDDAPPRFDQSLVSVAL